MSSVVNWFDIPATNFDRAVTFYETVLGISLIRENMLGAQMASSRPSRAKRPAPSSPATESRPARPAPRST